MCESVRNSCYFPYDDAVTPPPHPAVSLVPSAPLFFTPRLLLLLLLPPGLPRDVMPLPSEAADSQHQHHAGGFSSADGWQCPHTILCPSSFSGLYQPRSAYDDGKVRRFPILTHLYMQTVRKGSLSISFNVDLRRSPSHGGTPGNGMLLMSVIARERGRDFQLRAEDC